MNCFPSFFPIIPSKLSSKGGVRIFWKKSPPRRVHNPLICWGAQLSSNNFFEKTHPRHKAMSLCPSVGNPPERLERTSRTNVSNPKKGKPGKKKWSSKVQRSCNCLGYDHPLGQTPGLNSALPFSRSPQSVRLSVRQQLFIKDVSRTYLLRF